MRVDVLPHGIVRVIVPHGALTREELADAAKQLDEQLAVRERRVVVNMENVPYLDSAGIELLLARCGPGARSPRPRLCRLNDTCREALDLTEVLAQLEVFDNVESAVRSLKQ